MKDEGRRKVGCWIAAFGAIGIGAQVYLNQKLRQAVDNIHQNIILNPTLQQYTEIIKGKDIEKMSWNYFFFGSNFFVYLNAPLEALTREPVRDTDFGYSIRCLALKRKVEKLQWHVDNTHKVLLDWSEIPYNSLPLPIKFRSTHWILNPEIFRSGKTCGLHTFHIRLKDLIPFLPFHKCIFGEDIKKHDFFNPERQKFSSKPKEKFVLAKKTFSPRIQKFCQRELDSFFVYHHTMILTTKSFGYYKISYLMSPFDQRISVIGRIEKNKIRPFCSVFAEPGDVDVETMLKKIDQSVDWRVTLAFLSTVFLGLSLTY